MHCTRYKSAGNRIPAWQHVESSPTAMVFSRSLSCQPTAALERNELRGAKSPEIADILNSASDSEEDLITALRKNRTRCRIGESTYRVITRGDWAIGIFKDRIHKVVPHSSRSPIRKHRHRAKREVQVGSESVPPKVCHDASYERRIQSSQGCKANIQKRDTKTHSTKTTNTTPFHRARCDLPYSTVREPKSHKPEKPEKRVHVVSGGDLGGMPSGTRPRTRPIRKEHREHGADPPIRQTSAPRQRKDAHQSSGRSLLPATPLEEEYDAKIIQQLHSRQRPRELIVPECKWAYTVKCIDNADLILDEEDKKKRTMTIKTFADRQKANEYLHRSTSPETLGGIDAIVSRTSTIEGPQRLLKVDIQLSDGQHYISWVEQDMVVISELKAKMRKSKQWAPGERAKFPHYAVTCDLITYETCPVTFSTEKPQAEQNDDDDDEEENHEATGVVGKNGRLVFSGTNIDTRVEKLPLATFTFREMANEFAGLLFLEKSKVGREVVTPNDVQWWERTALPEHRRAVAAARRPNGLYELAMEAHDMGSRLGWNQIMVYVHEVPDVIGPVNF